MLASVKYLRLLALGLFCATLIGCGEAEPPPSVADGPKQTRPARGVSTPDDAKPATGS